jgi:7-carboxy-7-deazaguanine synthase
MTILDPTLLYPLETAPLQEVFSSVQGEGCYVGYRQVFVRFAHCHLKCAYCDTPMHTPSGECFIEQHPGAGHSAQLPNPVSTATLMQTLHQLFSQGEHHSVSFTGGEPLLYHRFLKACLPQVQPLCKTYLETSGTQPEFLEAVLPWVDIVAMDIKLPSATREAPQFEAHHAFYAMAKTNPKTELMIKLVFNHQITAEELEQVSRIVSDPEIPIILQPETPLDSPHLAIDAQKLFWIEQTLLKKHATVRVIPQTHKMMKLL